MLSQHVAKLQQAVQILLLESEQVPNSPWIQLEHLLLLSSAFSVFI